MLERYKILMPALKVHISNPERYYQWFGRNTLFLGNVNRYVPPHRQVSYTSHWDSWQDRPLDIEDQWVFSQSNFDVAFMSAAKYDRRSDFDVDKAASKFADLFLNRHYTCMKGADIVSHSDAISQLNKTAQPGVPWSLLYNSKRVFLEKEGMVLLLYWDSCNTLEGSCVFWTCSVKHELQLLKKYLAGKARTFTGSAVEHNYAMVRIFYQMNEMMNRAHRSTWSFVGGSKFKRGFDTLFSRLGSSRLGMPPRGFAADGEAFDATNLAYIQWKIFQFRVGCFSANVSPLTIKKAECLYHWQINSIIVMDDGTVFQKFSGMPSGSFMTLNDNTLVLSWIIAYSWFLTVPENFQSYEALTQCVEAALLGDDNDLTIAENVLSWFNFKSFSRISASLGFKFDLESDSALVPYYKLRFCSQSVRKYQDCWVPYPDRIRTLCALRMGGSVVNVQWHLLRGYGIRMDTWGCPSLFREVSLYCEHLKQLCIASPSSAVKGNVTIPFQEVEQLNFSWFELQDLYLGNEANLYIYRDKKVVCRLLCILYEDGALSRECKTDFVF